MKNAIKILLFFVCNFTILASSNIEGMKQSFKYNFIKDAEGIMSKKGVTGFADRIEADAMLELADETYNMYTDYKTFSKRNLIEAEDIILIMPRIDILEKHISALSKFADTIYLFIMEGDRLDTEYGDRSYETFIDKGLQNRMPANVKVFKLKNASVTQIGEKNNFEFSDIQQSRVFSEQIQPIYLEERRAK